MIMSSKQLGDGVFADHKKTGRGEGQMHRTLCVGRENAKLASEQRITWHPTFQSHTHTNHTGEALSHHPLLWRRLFPFPIGVCTTLHKNTHSHSHASTPASRNVRCGKFVVIRWEEKKKRQLGHCYCFSTRKNKNDNKKRKVPHTNKKWIFCLLEWTSVRFHHSLFACTTFRKPEFFYSPLCHFFFSFTLLQ